MKPTFTRRYRRHSKPAKAEQNFFRKESQETFFGMASQDVFFQPSVALSSMQTVHRKCEDCEKEEKKAHRKEDKKEEDKVMRMEDKKDEEKVQRQPEKEEENVQRAEDKKEEEKVMKKEDEEETIQKKESGATPAVGKSVSNYISSLNGKGKSLPAQDNHFFSSRMGYDFSNVKVHNDKEAAKSAKAINAKAYTIGNNVVFNEGQYNVESGEGKRLMAHELAHVVQGNKQKDREVQRKGKEVQHGGDPFPQASQPSLDSCGASSIIAAIMIHDQQDQTNSGFRAVCNIVLSHMIKDKDSIIHHFENLQSISEEVAVKAYEDILLELKNVKDRSVKDTNISGEDIKMLSNLLFILYTSTKTGLKISEIKEIQVLLHVSTGKTFGQLDSYDMIISSTALKGLRPGQIAQVSWYVKVNQDAKTGRYQVARHAFLIGRLNDTIGTWFLYDQALSPPAHFTAPTLEALDSSIKKGVSGGYWLFTGSALDMEMPDVRGLNGVTILGDNKELVKEGGTK